MCLSFLDNSLGAHERSLPHDSSRDPLYLCCRTPSAKDAAPPGAKIRCFWKEKCFYNSSKVFAFKNIHHDPSDSE